MKLILQTILFTAALTVISVVHAGDSNEQQSQIANSDGRLALELTRQAVMTELQDMLKVTPPRAAVHEKEDFRVNRFNSYAGKKSWDQIQSGNGG